MSPMINSLDSFFAFKSGIRTSVKKTAQSVSGNNVSKQPYKGSPIVETHSASLRRGSPGMLTLGRTQTSLVLPSLTRSLLSARHQFLSLTEGTGASPGEVVLQISLSSL